MNGEHLHTKAARGFDGSGDRVWNVVQLEIEKNLGACGRNSAHNFRTFRGIKLQPDFEKRDLAVQLFNELKRFLFCRQIQRDDDFSALLSFRAKSRNPATSPLAGMAGCLDYARHDDMQVFAPAKINLSLKILGRRNDGFHELDTLIAPISLYDELRIDKGSARNQV